MLGLGGGGLLQLLDDGVSRVKQLQDVLGVVSRHDVVAQTSIAGFKGQDAGQQLEHGGLAGAVGADQGHPVAPGQGQVHSLIDHLVAILLADVGQSNDLGAAAGRRGKGVVDFFRGPGQFNGLNLLQLLETALHLGGFGSLGAEPLDEAHLTLYFPFLASGGSA